MSSLKKNNEKKKKIHELTVVGFKASNKKGEICKFFVQKVFNEKKENL